MRISDIRLSWFRGAAKAVVLSPKGGSVAVFGPNGSGKSSFVDAVEVCVRSGKIDHLAHEYSGRFQEKGIINTHRPQTATTDASVTLLDGKSITCRWHSGGAPKLLGDAATELKKWNYRRAALRQDEIATFIKASKGEKYSALVPLLGLQHLEITAENLHRLQREVITLSKLDQLKRQIADVDQRRRAIFGQTANSHDLLNSLRRLDQQYAGLGDSISPTDLANSVSEAVQGQLNSLDAQSRQAAVLQEIAGSALLTHLVDARTTSTRITSVTEPFVKERLTVLEAASAFNEAIDRTESHIHCPACGTEVELTDFQAHLAAERERLQAADVH